MPRKTTVFRQSDITRALKGAMAAGVNVARVEVDVGGKIVVVVSAANEHPAESALDEWMASRARSS